MIEPLRLLNLYKERLQLLENKDNKLGLCRDIVNNPQIPNYKKLELIKEYTEHFNVNIRHYEDIIKTLRTIRKFYYDDSDEENEYTHYILNSS